MLDYFIFIYISHGDGISKIFTEIFFVFISVFICIKPKFTLRNFTAFLLKCILLWSSIQLSGGLLYLLGCPDDIVAKGILFGIYPVMLLICVFLFDKQTANKKLMIWLFFYAGWLFAAGIAGATSQMGILNKSNRISFAVMQLGLSGFVGCLIYFKPIDKIAFFPNSYFLVAFIFEGVFIGIYQMLHILIPDMTLPLLIIDIIFYLMSVLEYIVIGYIAKEHDEKVAEKIYRKELENEKILASIFSSHDKALHKMHHDIKNNYGYMKKLLSEEKYEELKTFFNGYTEDFNAVDALFFSGNDVIDNILSIESVKAKNIGVHLDIKTILPTELPFNGYDLVSLLMNLIDNAIEASTGNFAKEQSIEINLRFLKEILLIRISNPLFDNQQKEKTLELKTSKSDKELHGYGLRIVREIVNKYHGSIIFNIEQGRFIADCMLASPESETEEK